MFQTTIREWDESTDWTERRNFLTRPVVLTGNTILHIIALTRGNFFQPRTRKPTLTEIFPMPQTNKRQQTDTNLPRLQPDKKRATSTPRRDDPTGSSESSHGSTQNTSIPIPIPEPIPSTKRHGVAFSE